MRLSRALPRNSLDSVSATEEKEPDEATTVVLLSSTELLCYYRQSLEQCAKYSRRQVLYDLCTLPHKRWLQIYRTSCLLVLDGPNHELKHASIVINAVDSCQTTATSELEEGIRREIDKGFKEKVTLQAERGLFVGVISRISLAIAVQQVACEPAFSTMSKMTWNTLSQASG
ncbi:hypothetical protein M378DRAFT_591611 [Amanita muscaria Koide BX008]|uniref:Uncharacterized protein n=1 Tax=Amanita muscaria (strain Koide BX008) TaxID=946122 RepID=A0A0C2WFV2_AMAMK|nr:hypothetical protein M378DRAFT_591611 [Amanita muscaria Koide BX008]